MTASSSCAITRTRLLLVAFTTISLIYIVYTKSFPRFPSRDTNNLENFIEKNLSFNHDERHHPGALKDNLVNFDPPDDFLLPLENEDAPKFQVDPTEFFSEDEAAEDSAKATSLKKILFWNDDYRNKHFGFGFGQEPFLRAGCRVNTCTTTGNRDKYPLQEIDAIIWHFRSDDRSMPGQRFPHTRYVFWMLESPDYLYGDIKTYDNIFNWTMTYRLDSDFPHPYGILYRRRRPLQEITRNYAEGKTKLAAWFVSNCYTRGGRETLVQTLQQWVSVDIYGKCGPMTCERSHQNQCYKNLNETYKFYLSFENSLCQDYVTEKFFNILQLDVVPVVYGLGNYSFQAPPHSYIDALSFRTAKDLADYLLYLDKNDTAYNEYFTWKKDYFVSKNWARVAQAYCNLCERLHTDNSIKVYKLSEWFEEKAHCVEKWRHDLRAFIGTGRYSHAATFLACLFIMLLIGFVFGATVLIAQFCRRRKTNCWKT